MIHLPEMKKYGIGFRNYCVICDVLSWEFANLIVTNRLDFLPAYLLRGENIRCSVGDPVPFVCTHLVCLQITFSQFVRFASSSLFVTIL